MAQVITQPHSSPDLTHYGFYLFPKFEDRLRGRQFSSDEEEKRFVQVWLRVLPANFFHDDLAKVLRRWQTFLGRGGHNMESKYTRSKAKRMRNIPVLVLSLYL